MYLWFLFKNIGTFWHKIFLFKNIDNFIFDFIFVSYLISIQNKLQDK